MHTFCYAYGYNNDQCQELDLGMGKSGAQMTRVIDGGGWSSGRLQVVDRLVLQSKLHIYRREPGDGFESSTTNHDKYIRLADCEMQLHSRCLHCEAQCVGDINQSLRVTPGALNPVAMSDLTSANYLPLQLQNTRTNFPS